MIHKLLSALVLLLFNISVLCAGETPRDFPMSKPLIMENKEAENLRYAEFFLDSEIYAAAQKSLADIRIMDSQGNFIPWIMETSGSVTQTEETIWKAVLVESWKTDKKEPAENNRPVQVYQVVPEPEEEADLMINGLEFQLPDKTGSKAWSVEVMIEGRTDTGSFTFVKKDSLYRMEQSEKNFIPLDAPVSYNFWRISFLSGSRDMVPTGIIPRWNASREEVRPFVRTLPLRITARTEKEGYSLLELISPYHLPLSALLISGEGQYSRECRVKSSDAPSTGNIAYGRILRWEGDPETYEEMRILFPQTESAPEKLFVEIENGSDKPLTIRSVTAEYLPVRIVFERQQNQDYRVLFGNPDAMAPSYDLEAFRDTIAGKPRLTLVPGTLEENVILVQKQEESTFPWKILLNMLLILAGVGLTALILVTLRRQKG